jgi:hypothetical protein
MDYTYIKGDRVPGFQVIESGSGPDHIYSACAPKNSSTPQKRGSKRAISTPAGKKHLNMNIKGLNWCFYFYFLVLLSFL